MTVSLRTASGDSVFFAGLLDTVLVDVSVDSEGELITGVELFLSYDPTLFIPIDTDATLSGNQPASSAGVLGQVFADSILIGSASEAFIHYAEVDLTGQMVSDVVMTVQFLQIGLVSGISPIRVSDNASFPSLYTPLVRDGESIPIPASAQIVFEDLPPTLSGISEFRIEEDGGPAFLAADLATDRESGSELLTFSVVMSNTSAGAMIEGDSLRFSTAENFAGVLNGQLTVTDPAGGEDSRDIVLNVAALNDPPVIKTSTLADTVSVGGDPVVIELIGGDVDDDAESLLRFALEASDSLDAGVEGTILTLTAVKGWKGSVLLSIQLADPGGLVDLHSIRVVGTSIPGDFDGNDLVDFADFLMFADAFGGTSAKFDLDGSGLVDFGDFLIFVGNFG